ncbi:histone chaperone HIRA-like protein [Actinidia rufa]|uniref:Histone chaperone HIRA-like protein n=1 Tax=Actinidia rufa TaxID=165716 RepID=A0A7J0HB29_9ERIC|nr:histone chaperone HIRA-like protein [Actinidia rufa]
MSSPMKQRESRAPDGRKRIVPEALGVVVVQQESISDDVQSPAIDFPMKSSHPRQDDNALALNDNGIKECSVRRTTGGNSGLKGVTARTTISESLVIEKVPASAGRDGSVFVDQTGIVKASGSSAASSKLSIRVFDKEEGEDAIPVCLEAHPREHAVNDTVGVGNTSTMKETEIACTRGAQTLWSDRISGKVTVLAGNSNFWAVGCEDGGLQLFKIDLLLLSLVVFEPWVLRLGLNCYIHHYGTIWVIPTACYDRYTIGPLLLNFTGVAAAAFTGPLHHR